MQRADGILHLIFLMAMAFVINTFIYFSFANVYSSEILTYQNFEGQFSSGIYQYRILSGFFFFWVYDLLSGLQINYDIFKLKFLQKDSEPQVYVAFYILNTLFLLASTLVLHFILQRKEIMATSIEKLMIGTITVFSIAITQFVIVPYDVSSYFFILLFALVFIKYLEKESGLLFTLLCIILVLSALNRETAALSLSFAATLLYSKFGISRKALFKLLPLVVCFVSVYIGLRYFMKTFTTNDGNLFLQNFTEPKNLLGILFWLVFFLFSFQLAKTSRNKKMILLFHVFALPYLVMCFYSGILYEVRLYVPLFLCSLLLGNLKTEEFKTPII